MIDRMKATDRRLHDAINARQFDVIDEVCTPDVVIHDPNMPTEVRSREGFKLYLAGYQTAFPDFRVEDLVVIGEGEYLAGRMRLTGTHRGPFLDVAPTGRSIDVESLYLIRFEGELEAEFWLYGNATALYEQLGVKPQAALTGV